MKLLLICLLFFSLKVTAIEKGIKVSLEKQNRVETLAIRITTNRANSISNIKKAYKKIVQYLRSVNIKKSYMAYTRFIKPSKGKQIIEVGIITNGKIKGNNEIHKRFLPKTMALVSFHKGPYNQLPARHKKLDIWIKKKKKKINGLRWEEYINDPKKTTPDKYLTRIVAPIK
jgi:effector-binding domain-containing protein